MLKGSPQVGVIADTSFLRYIIAHAVESQGYGIKVATAPEHVDYDLVRGEVVDAWVVELDDQDKWTDMVDELLDQAHAPIFFGDGKAPSQTSLNYPRWQRRIYTKLTQILGPPSLAEQQSEEIAALQKDSQNDSGGTGKPPALTTIAKSNQPTTIVESLPNTAKREDVPLLVPVLESQVRSTTASGIATNDAASAGASKLPERIWVLGASLGGPAAVKLFLDELPEGLPIAFVLAQHIDAGFQEVLVQALSRHSHFKVSIAQNQQYLKEGEILIAPVENEIQFSAGGQVIKTTNPWDGPYSPSIDQVMMNVQRAFGGRCGAIIFSGMGNDSAIAGPLMKDKGSVIWAQTADSCANSSQPDSIRDTGCVDYSGTPQALAFQLVERIRRESKEQKLN